MPLLYRQSDPSTLVPLLVEALPHSLPLLGALQTQGVPLNLYATFRDPSIARDETQRDQPQMRPGWILIGDYGNQVRFFASAELTFDHLDDEAQAHARRLVEAVFGEFLRDHVDGRS
ncbi:hypothetical protein JCM10212_000448, partial [Sporobolomyces blumeae]